MNTAKYRMGALEELVSAMNGKVRELKDTIENGGFGMFCDQSGLELNWNKKHRIQPNRIAPTLAQLRSKLENLKELKSSYLRIWENLTDEEVNRHRKEYIPDRFAVSLRAIESTEMVIAILREDLRDSNSV